MDLHRARSAAIRLKPVLQLGEIEPDRLADAAEQVDDRRAAEAEVQRIDLRAGSRRGGQREQQIDCSSRSEPHAVGEIRNVDEQELGRHGQIFLKETVAVVSVRGLRQ